MNRGRAMCLVGGYESFVLNRNAQIAESLRSGTAVLGSTSVVVRGVGFNKMVMCLVSTII